MKAVELSPKTSQPAKEDRRDYQVRRIFSHVEAEEIKELQKNAAVFRDNYPGYEKWIRMAIDEVVKGKRVAFGAFKPVLDKDSKPVVKLVGSMIVKEEKYGAGVELKNLFVGEEYRRQGCGTALENAVERHYSKKRYRVIKTEVPANEKGTISFLLECGYRVLLTKESAHKAGEYVTEMQKELPIKYGGDYYDRSDFCEWLLSHIYNLTVTAHSDNVLMFSLEPKRKTQGDNRTTVKGVLLINDEQTDVTTETVRDFVAKHPGDHIKMLFGRTVSAEAKAECDKQGIIVFDDPSIISQFGDCFAYKPPAFKIEEIAGTVVVVNGDYIDIMQGVKPKQNFTYFKGGKVGKYLKPKNKVLFFFTSSQKCPESGILACADIVTIHDNTPDNVWNAYESHNPLFTKDSYKSFVENKQTILAIECTNLTWISPIGQSQLCDILGEEDLDLDDIGHLYLSAKMMVDFQDMKKVVEVGINKTALKAGDEFKPTFGIITALPLECASVQCMLTNSEVITQNGNQYIRGEIRAFNGQMHSIVMALAGAGTTLAAARARALLEKFSSVDSLIMVGIAGGVPNVQKPSEHVRLGDIVVSNEGGTVQYDFVKEEINSVTHRTPPRPPSAKLLQAVKFLETASIQGKRPWEPYIEQGMNCMEPKITRPNEESDVLMSNDGKMELKHPVDPLRVQGHPRVFLGTIGSSNTLQKNPDKRDFLRDKFGVKAIEMEASGVADAGWDKNIGFLVVRGICDYCDTKKNDVWQRYAAIVAAAYACALIESIPSEITKP